MTTPRRPLQLRLSLHDNLLVDNFAGGGGASTAIEQVFGRPVDIAVNHDPEAIAMHEANHPHTRHYCQDVFSIAPVQATGGRRVALAWFSPDCKHFSKAKGGKPRSHKIRDLAWVVVRWAKKIKPSIIALENVEEFRDWGPLLPDGRPCPTRKGTTFDRWVSRLEALGYVVDCRQLRACDYGAPTIRKRLFLIARCDGLPIVWPDPTHGDPQSEAVKAGHLAPWPTAADCIDWTLPCPSIFERVRPLAENTMRRIARGIQRYVIEAAEPYIVTCNHGGPGLEKPLGTAATPLGTITAAGQGKTALITSHLIKLYGTCQDGAPIAAPLPTVTATGQHIGEVRAFVIKYYGTGRGSDLRNPLHTVTAHDRFGLVTVADQQYQIADIGMRMLSPRELFRAQGFPDHYRIELAYRDPGTGKTKRLSKSAQVRMCGNSVSPAPAAALLRANCAHLLLQKEENERTPHHFQHPDGPGHPGD